MPKATHDYSYRWDPGVREAEDQLCARMDAEEAAALVSLTCEALGVPVPEVRWDRRGGGGMYLWRGVIRLPLRGTAEEGIILHEVAHHVFAVRDRAGAKADFHGPGFLRVFREVLALWTEVPWREAITPPRFTRAFAAQVIREATGAEAVMVSSVRRDNATRRTVWATQDSGGGWTPASWYRFEAQPGGWWMLTEGYDLPRQVFVEDVRVNVGLATGVSG